MPKAKLVGASMSVVIAITMSITRVRMPSRCSRARMRSATGNATSPAPSGA